MSIPLLSVRAAYALRNVYLRIGIAIFIAGFAFLFWSYFGYLRVWSDRLDHRMSEFKQLNRSVELLEQDAKNIVRYESALSGLETLEKRLSSHASQVAMVEQLNNLARLSGVQVKASTFKNGKQDESILRSHQEIVLNGSYMGLREFLKGLARLPALTVATETRVERDKNSRDVNARIHLITYQSVKQREDDQ